MLVVAFDGILFDTLPHRATAIVNALAAEGLHVSMHDVLRRIAGLSLGEAVRATVAEYVRADSNLTLDETALDLATLRAERAAAELVSRGGTLNVIVRDKLRRAATITRIVVRADSHRRQVDELLAMSELDSVIAMTRCSDDALSPRIRNAAQLSLPLAYEHIVMRMAANGSLLGNSSSIGVALEVQESARNVARAFGFEAPDSFEGTSFAAPN